MIASHYAEPARRSVARAGPLRAGADKQSEAVGEVREGDPFDCLDDSRGWAWGYAGAARLVGYLPSAWLR